MGSSERVGHYRIEVRLFDHPAADVFLAVDTVRKRSVTLWVLKHGIFSDRAAEQRFVRKVQSAADLIHPHLAWVWEAGEADGNHFVVERHIEGPTLRRHLQENGPLSWDEAAVAIEQLAQGLDFAHKHGHTHGGIRSELIYLSRQLGAVLGGFGVPGPAAYDLTAAEADLAGASYWAPELWRGENPSPASDRYALACIFAEMLGGCSLFAGSSAEAIRDAHLGSPSLPAIWPAETPLEIEPALERGLAKEPARRYETAVDLAAAPTRLAASGGLTAAERTEREALRLRRLEAAELARREAEETARLEALKQARRELEEQIPNSAEELEAESITAPAPGNTIPHPETGSAVRSIHPEAHPPTDPVPAPIPETAPAGTPLASRRAARRRRTLSAWTLRMLVAAIMIGAAWAVYAWGWLPGQPPAAPTAAATAETLPAAAATATPTIPPTQTASPSPTSTQTASPTPTIRPTSTPSRTPSQTATQTSTPVPTGTRLPTDVLNSRDRDGG